MVRFLVVISIIMFVSSCLLDQKLAMVQTNNDSQSLRLDGVYLHEDSLNIVDIFFLYRDGTILSRGSIPKYRLANKLDQLEVSKVDKYKSMKFLWGRYIINGSEIKFEKWGNSDKVYRAFVREGDILNDTTFVIHKFYNSNGNDVRALDETYRFRKTNTKPDSLNRWVGIGK